MSPFKYYFLARWMTPDVDAPSVNQSINQSIKLKAYKLHVFEKY